MKRKAKFILGAMKETLEKYVRDYEVRKHIIVGKRLQIFGYQYYMIEVLDSEERPFIDMENVEEMELSELLENHNLELEDELQK